jgi:hypothetical protein
MPFFRPLQALYSSRLAARAVDLFFPPASLNSLKTDLNYAQ